MILLLCGNLLTVIALVGWVVCVLVFNVFFIVCIFLIGVFWVVTLVF